jgi:ABC-type bacteriocin/lantibiotic exporter with double-glycine peptidase domain
MHDRSPDSVSELDHAIHVLSLFAQASLVDFDRILATRILGESLRALPGTGPQAWAYRLVEVGESLGLRVRHLECSLEEALQLTGEGMPVCTCRLDQNGKLRWYAVAETNGRKLRLTGIEGQRDRWVSHQQFCRTLQIPDSKTPTTWLVGQAALPCASDAATVTPRVQAPSGHQGSGASPASHGHGAGHHGADEHSTSPLRRLMQLLRPERSDILTVMVFSTVVGMLALATPIAVEALVNTVAFGRFTQPVIVLSLILLIFLGFGAAFEALNVTIVEILQRRLFTRVVEDLAYRLPRVDQRALDGCHGPELANRFFDVVTIQKVTASMVLDGLGVVLQMIIGMMVLAFYHPFLLGFDLVLLASVLFVFLVLGQGAVKASIGESRAKYAAAAWLQSLALHTTAFKMHGGNQFALNQADQLAINYLEARKKHFSIFLRQLLFMLGLQAIAATALLGLGGWLVLQGELTLGQLVAAELIVTIIVGSLAKMGKYVESFYDLLASVDKLGMLFDLPIEPHDHLFHLSEARPASLRLHAVEYGYGGPSVLERFSASISPGERVALVGPSGCGKSTLIDILCAIRTQQHGYVEMDGIDLRELRPDSLREHVAMSRGIEIFPGTIAENVHLHRPQISAADVRDSLAAVGLLDVLSDLPDNLNTVLQTGGVPLSTTQAQLLMLARAIVGRPRLLLIDGTLDALGERMLEHPLAAILAPGAPWTVLIATHRQEIAERCQRTVTLRPFDQHGDYALGDPLSTEEISGH